jgi:hypothetical protein
MLHPIKILPYLAARRVVRLHYALPFSLILVLALLYRIFPMTRGLGQDELFTAVHFVEVPSIWTTMFFNIAFNNHIGYSLMARCSEALLGRSEWALRLPSLLLGVATLYVFFLFTRSILDSGGGLLAALVLALSPPHIVWNVEARGYSAMIFFTLLSSHFYLRLIRHPARREAAAFIGVSTLGIYSHLYSVFITVVQILSLIYLCVTRDISKQTALSINKASFRMLSKSFAAIAVMSLLIYAAALLHIFRDLVGRGRSDFNPSFPWTVIQELSGSDWPQIVALVALVSSLGWLVLLRSHPLEASYFGLLLVGPLLIVSVARPFDLYPRFFAYWLPYYLLLFVAGLRFLWNLASSHTFRFFGTYLYRTLAATIVVCVLYNWAANSQRYIPEEGYREASRTILLGAKEPTAFCAIGGARSVWQYYIDKPIVTPTSVTELQNLSKTYSETRCVYYEASWQSAEQTEIAHFLLQHASWSRVKDFTIFTYQNSRKSRILD